MIAVCDAYDFGTPASQIGPGVSVDRETRDRRARERLDAAVAHMPAGTTAETV